MKVLSPAKTVEWLKGKQAYARARGHAEGVTVAFPDNSAGISSLAERLAALSGWSGAVLALSRPGMPRAAAVAEVAALHHEYGVHSSAADVQAGPGHLLDEEPLRNRFVLARLLRAMMSGYLEGRLVTKNGGFIAMFGCGTIEFHVTDKRLAGRLRTALRELALAAV